MSRHRNVRSMNYEEEYDGYDDVYGHSVEENDYSVSPNTASQFMFDRSDAQLSSFLNDHEKIPEEDESEASTGEDSLRDSLQDSANFTRPKLTDLQEAQLNSCLEQMHSILGDSTPEHILVDAVIQADFDHEKALNFILTQQEAPKPQRAPREPRERDYEKSSTKPLSCPSQLDSPVTDGNHNVTLPNPSVKSTSLESVGGRVPEVELPLFTLSDVPKCTDQNHPSRGNQTEAIPVGNVQDSARSASKPISLAHLAKSQSSPRSPFSPPNIRQGSPTARFVFGTPPRQDLANRGPGPSLAALAQCHQAPPSQTTSSQAVLSHHYPRTATVPQAQLLSLSPSSCISPSTASLSTSPAHVTTSVNTSHIKHTALSIAGITKLTMDRVEVNTFTTKAQAVASPSELPKGTAILTALAQKDGTKGPSLADLASIHQGSRKGGNKQPSLLSKPMGIQQGSKGTPFGNLPSAKGFSLAELAQEHSKTSETVSSVPKTAGFSLAELAQQHEKKDTKLSSTPPGLKTLPDLSRLAASHSLVTLKPTSGNAGSGSKTSGTIFAPSVTTAETGSSIGCAICSTLVKDTDHQEPLLFPYFSHVNQLKSSGVSSADPALFTAQGFDFSSPSPDDIVMDRQKGAFLRTGGRVTTSAAGEVTEPTSDKPPVVAVLPTVVTATAAAAAPKVVAPSPGVSDGVARMTFTTGSKVASGFTPQKEEEDEGTSLENNGAAVELVKRDLSDRLAFGDKQNGEAASELMSTPKRGRLEGGEDSVTSTPKSTVKQKRNPEAIRREYLRRQDSGKQNLNLVVIGHVDAGKSTLMGHVLYQLGFVNKKTMHKYETEAKKMGKASFAYAWVLDETEEERARGVTMDVAQTRFETDSKIVTLLDAPGHKDFIPNMITGAAQADVAILVVNAARGEFETGFEAGGQTREHAMLIRSLGVSQLIVAVNKMDMVDYNQQRFEEIVKKLGSFLKTAGFREGDVKYVPCSGLTGENLSRDATQDTLKRWYSGPCLASLIDQLKPPERQYERPYRQCITDVFKGMGAGISVSGTIQAGCIQPGEKVCIMPQGEVANVRNVLIDEIPVQYAFAGDNATMVLTNIDQLNLTIGSIVCDPNNPIKVTSRIQARVVVFNIAVPITRGFPVVFHYQSMSEPATICKLVSQLNKSSGEVVKKKPRCLAKHTSAIVEIELERPICVELYKDFKDLGRFMLRYSGATIAAGLITQIIDPKQT